ncbi:MAG: YIP1 family protein [Byssovorax sp.]
MSAGAEVSADAQHAAPRPEGAPSLLGLLFSPDRTMERQAKVGRVRWAFLIAWLCSILLGAALAYRMDARQSTLQKLDESGELKSMSDRQIADETTKAERVAQAGQVAKGVVGAPLDLAGASVAVLALGWFLRGKIKGSAVGPVAAASLLPGAIARLLDAIAAYQHAQIPPEGIPLSPRTLAALLTLYGHPPGEPWLKLAGALDFFSLWSALILGFGVAAAAQLSRRSALIATLIAWVCYQLLTRVAT